MSLYEELLAAGIPLDSHESDLYALVTSDSRVIVARSEHGCSTFISNIDGKLWFDLPFAYDPWWIRRQA